MADNRDEWLGIGVSLFNYNSNYCFLWNGFSKRSGKYVEGEPFQLWKGFNRREESKMNIKYIMDKALIRNVPTIPPLISYYYHVLRGSDERHAEYYLHQVKHNIKIINKNTCYIFNDKNKLWEKKAINFIVEQVGKTFDKLVFACKKFFLSKRQYKTQDDDIDDVNTVDEDISFYLNYIKKCENTCLSSGHDDNVLKKLRKNSEITDCEFEIKLNKIRHLLPIKNNLVANLRTGETEPRTKEHYFTFFCPVSLLDRNHKLKHANRFFNDISNDREEWKEYAIKYLGYFLTGETSDRTYHIWIGEGHNGKSAVMDINLRHIQK